MLKVLVLMISKLQKYIYNLVVKTKVRISVELEVSRKVIKMVLKREINDQTLFTRSNFVCEKRFDIKT